MVKKQLNISSVTAWLAGLLALIFVFFAASVVFEKEVKPQAGLISGRAVKTIIRTCEHSPPLVDAVADKLAAQPLPFTARTEYDQYIMEAAACNGVSPALVKAVIHAESNFNPHAVSPRGAVGLMQLMPATLEITGATDPFNPRQNIEGGVKYLKDLLIMFEGNIELAVAAYNTGPGVVLRYGGLPPYGETRVFVRQVMKYYQVYLRS